MRWLERHAWWGLLLIMLAFVSFGVTDLLVGPAADRAIPLALTGVPLDQLQAEGGAGYRLFDFFTRANGASLVLVGLWGSAILLFGFRRNQRWAWWAMWLLPVWAVSAAGLYVVFGVDPTQPPPPPMISGPIVAVIAAAILGVSSPRFFRSESRPARRCHGRVSLRRAFPQIAARRTLGSMEQP
jgi:hypothetical protein